MKSTRNKTGYKGVYQSNGSPNFTARIQLFNKKINLGVFATAEEAARVHDAYLEKYESEHRTWHSNRKQALAKRRVRHDCISGYHGVYYVEPLDKFRATCNGTGLGNFDTPEEAALEVNSYINRFKVDHPLNEVSVAARVAITQKQEDKQKTRKIAQEELELRRPKLKAKRGPEWKIQQDVIRYLEDRNWIVKVVHATMYNFGFPDVIATHKKYGIKFIEIKRPTGYTFTAAQYKFFPQFCANGAPIYILTAANEENYQRLFGKSNLWIYMGKISDGK